MELLKDVLQGSDAWHAHRASHYNASDAPAMMGESPYKTRNELLKECATGIFEEIDSRTQALFDEGHRAEALARPLAEKIIGKRLYPVVGSLGMLSASFDGLPMSKDVIYEHKLANKALREALPKEGENIGAVLPRTYQIQMEQQCIVSEVKHGLFMASKWEGDKLVEERHCWYESNPELALEIEAGWAQFHIDKLNYKAAEVPVIAQAEVIQALPALVIQTEGKVLASNFPEFLEKANAFIDNIRTELATDQEFADAKAMVKFCGEAEKDLERAKNAAIQQTASVADLLSEVTHVQERLRQKRLALDKLVTTQESSIKETKVLKAKTDFAEHLAAAESEITPIRIVMPAPDFAAAIKGKKTIKGLQDGLDNCMADAKITVNQIAADYRKKLAWIKESHAEHGALFRDLQQIIVKPLEDFQLTVNTRVNEFKEGEEKKAQELRDKIAAEEKVKAEANAKQKLLAEQALEALEKKKLDDEQAAAETAKQTLAATAVPTAFKQAHQDAIATGLGDVTITADTGNHEKPIQVRRVAHSSMVGFDPIGIAADAPIDNQFSLPIQTELREVGEVVDASIETGEDIADIDLIEYIAIGFDMTVATALERIRKIDFETARREITTKIMESNYNPSNIQPKA